jgi:hypothetical protein
VLFQPVVWLVDTDRSSCDRIIQLFRRLDEAYTVRRCSRLATVVNDLSRKRAGVVVADLTGHDTLPLADRAVLTSLGWQTPVLLLVDGPGLAHRAHRDFGMCNVLFQPFSDIDRILIAVANLADELTSRDLRSS